MRRSDAAPGERRAREARRERRRSARREQILDAAREVLVRDGLDGFNAAAVARAADCSKPALFYYFDSLEEVVAALAESLFRREAEVLRAAVEDAGSGIEALAALVRAYVDHHARDLDTFSVLQAWTRRAGVQERLLERQVYPAAAGINDRLEAMLRRDRRGGRLHADVHPRRMANLAYVTAHGIVSLLSGLRALGGDTRFGIEELRDEACAVLERAARA